MLLISLAFAKQLDFDREKAGEDERYHVRWTDAGGDKQEVRFTLASDDVKRDLDRPLHFPARDAGEAMAAAANRAADDVKGVKFSAKASKSGAVRMSARGTASGVQKAMKKAKAAEKAALANFMDDHRYIELYGGMIDDHARIAVGEASRIRPLAEALAEGEKGERAYVRRALSFVQSIPYEKRKGGKDAGFRKPLAVVARNRADCDGKSTLFLSLVRAAYPKLDAAVVYVPGHAFAGVALDPKPGERTFRRDGVRYVVVEPVGPYVAPIGKASGVAGWHLFWGSAQVHALK